MIVDKKVEFLLDMDGVLADFISSAVKALNRDYGKTITMDQYVKEFGKWGTYDYYGISVSEFWKSIENTPNFWINIEPYPWYQQLYNELSKLGNVTILTAPSLDPICIVEKYAWLEKYLGIKSDKVMLGQRKYLMAGNGILIDDYDKNVNSFILSGGNAILVPSNWNTRNLTFDRIWNKIEVELALIV